VTGIDAGKGKNWYLWAEKEVLGQFWIVNKEKTMCSQDLRELFYSFGLYFLVSFFIFLD